MKSGIAKSRGLKGKTILLIITGSIAAYKIPDLIQALRDE
jgi:phosphopantothenoylcysteine synthetase/decarboxylase